MKWKHLFNLQIQVFSGPLGCLNIADINRRWSQIAFFEYLKKHIIFSLYDEPFFTKNSMLQKILFLPWKRSTKPDVEATLGTWHPLKTISPIGSVGLIVIVAFPMLKSETFNSWRLWGSMCDVGTKTPIERTGYTTLHYTALVFPIGYRINFSVRTHVRLSAVIRYPRGKTNAKDLCQRSGSNPRPLGC